MPTRITHCTSAGESIRTNYATGPYHARSRAETKMKYLKIRSERIASRDPDHQTAEMQIRGHSWTASMHLASPRSNAWPEQKRVRGKSGQRTTSATMPIASRSQKNLARIWTAVQISKSRTNFGIQIRPHAFQDIPTTRACCTIR